MNRKIKRFEAKCALIIKFRSFGKFNSIVCMAANRLRGPSDERNCFKRFQAKLSRVVALITRLLIIAIMKLKPTRNYHV